VNILKYSKNIRKIIQNGMKRKLTSKMKISWQSRTLERMPEGCQEICNHGRKNMTLCFLVIRVLLANEESGHEKNCI